jgi:anti-sigma factor RsiW
MSEERGCERYADELAELALGVLTGRERAQVLSHVESCPRCAEELEILSRTADTVLQAAPDMEPPLGFEVRLFERMGVTDAAPRRRRHFRPSRWVPAVVGVAAAALALGIGLSVTSSAPSSNQAAAPSPSHQVLTGALVADGETVGHVTAVGGDKPWMSMTLDDDAAAHGTVRCVVVTEDGVTHDVGTFETSKGYGAWMAPLHVDPATIRTAEVVSPSGTVIATATLS